MLWQQLEAEGVASADLAAAKASIRHIVASTVLSADPHLRLAFATRQSLYNCYSLLGETPSLQQGDDTVQDWTCCWTASLCRTCSR